MFSVSAAAEKGICKVCISGRIDSGNADEAEREIRESLFPGDLVIDTEDLEYLSSAGLRVILRLRKEHPEMKIIGASPRVYEIFDMTGFTALLPVEKAFRRIDVEGCEVIGSGANGDVLRLNDDTVIKLYKDPDSLDEIMNERAMAKKAFIAGIPTAISYDVVKVGDSYASMFELINARSLANALKAEPEKLEYYAYNYAELLRLIHSTPAADDLPSIKEKARKWAAYLSRSGILSAEASEKLPRLIDEVPENHHMIHGDCHAKNVMIQNGEMILIDMDTLSYGDPVFELGTMYFCYRATSPEEGEVFLGLSEDLRSGLWNRMFREYYRSEDEALLKEKEDKAAVIGLTRFLYHFLRHNDGSPAAQDWIARSAERLNALVLRLESLV